jgi:threonine/homoserine/homoserine lactone efflux protein
MGESFLLGPLVLFAAVMSLTPGPNVVMVTASAVNFGFRRVIPHMLGITLGFGLLVMGVGLGLASLFQAEPRLHAALKYAGAAYLLYLAGRIARADGAGGAAIRPKPIGFVEAALFQLVNPKGWVFAVGAIAAYSTVGGDPLRETSVIAGVNAAMCLLSVVVWAAFGTGIGRLLATSRARRIFNWSMAGLLMLSLVPVFWPSPVEVVGALLFSILKRPVA